MSRISRRGLLTLLAAGGIAAGGAAFAATRPVTEAAGRLLTSDLRLPPRFKVPLPIPIDAVPVSTDGGVDHYQVVQRPAKVEIVPGTRTEVWGYDGTFPGPTFRARRGRPVTVSITNELDVPTSTHLHGGVTPADSDGFPTDIVVPVGLDGQFQPAANPHMTVADSVWRRHDGSRDYEYPVDQAAATLWYHDHRMDFTAPQVWRGLAGFFIIGDETEDALGLPEGRRDIPLLICDRAFHADGSFKYPAVDGTLLGTPGVTGDYHQGVEGDIILVNGAPWPIMDVAAARYRFRILNASNARRYQLALEPAPDSGGFTQIGSDLGLLAAPQLLPELVVSPAERFDVVVDFSGYPPGTEVTMVNRFDSGPAGAVMRFRVGEAAEDDSTVPETLAPFEKLTTDQVVGDRSFRFQSTGHLWTINGHPYDPSASLATVALDSVERWTLTSDFHHPIHVHLGHFQVLSRGGSAPEPRDAGWKDTVDLRPLEVVEVLVRFSGHRGRYMMHCHNLEHEDMAMMANFDVV